MLAARGIKPLCNGEDKMVRQTGLNSTMQCATYSLGSLGAGNPLHGDAISGLFCHAAGPADSKTATKWCYEDKQYWGLLLHTNLYHLYICLTTTEESKHSKVPWTLYFRVLFSPNLHPYRHRTERFVQKHLCRLSSTRKNWQIV